MPVQIQAAVYGLFALFFLRYILSALPGDPFQRVRFNGNLLIVQSGLLSLRYSVQRSSVRKVIITQGSISVVLDSHYQGRVLKLTFDKEYSREVLRFMQRQLAHAAFEYTGQRIPGLLTQRPALRLVK